MKLKFKNQAFQMDAVNAVVDLFTGQEKTKSTFSVVDERQTSLLPEMGQGNALYIDQETLTSNMHTVQKRNNLPLTPSAKDCQFCIEMETGTGKTYTYVKTIYACNMTTCRAATSSTTLPNCPMCGSSPPAPTSK